MKQIINGKRYDTETAQLINEIDWHDQSVNKWMKESLYRKKTGEFFLYEDKYSTWGNIRPFEKIIPYTESEARSWVEKHANDSYEEIFGEVNE